MPLGSRNRAQRLRGCRRKEPTYLFKDEIPVLVGVQALQVVVQCVANLLQGQHNCCRSEASDMLPDEELHFCMPVQHGRARGWSAHHQAERARSQWHATSSQPQAPWHNDAAQIWKVLLGMLPYALSHPWPVMDPSIQG